MFYIFLFLSLIISSICFAGNGSSGGGHIYGDQVNPWYLQNTKKVTYCAELSSDFSSITQAEVEKTIQKAFAYWKKQFLGIKSSDFNLDPKPEVGGQKFILSECSSTVDIRFQMGFLTLDQIKLFEKPRQMIATAYREVYDEINLKGKGFVYVAPERGMLKPASKDFIKNAWSLDIGTDKSPLLGTLIHEIGHIFGLQDDHQSRKSLMGAGFVEHITSKKNFGSIRFVLEEHAPLGVQGKSNIDRMVQSNHWHKGVKKLFGMPSNTSLLQFIGKGKNIDVWADNNKVGTLNLNSKNVKKVNLSKEEYIMLWLPKKQTVFKDGNRVSQYYYTIYEGNKSVTLEGAEYKKISGDKEIVNAYLSDHSQPKIGAIINGKYSFDILSLTRFD